MKTTPRAHQLKEFELYNDEKSRALLWYMRSGKSKAMIDLACHLATTRDLRLAIVIAPNGVHQVWTDEQLPAHHWDEVAYGSSTIESKKVGRRKWDEGFEQLMSYAQEESEGLLWLTLIKEALNVSRVRQLLYKAIRERGKTLLIVDECQHFGNPNSLRSEHIRALAARCEYKRILTGSEADDGLEKVYGQYEILKPGALGCHSFDKFQRQFCETTTLKIKNRNGFTTPQEKITGYKNVKKLKRRMAAWSSRVTRKDADLPPLIPMTRKFDLPADLQKIYDEVLKTGHLGVLGKPDAAADGMRGLNRLGQLTSGFYYEDGGGPVEFAKNPRLEILADFLETVPDDEQVIIWCAFAHEVDQVSTILDSAHGKYYGRQGGKENVKAMNRFKSGQYHTLVGTPHSGGEGLELGCASTVIWFSHVTSNRMRKQASERASSSGDKVALVDIVANCNSDKFLVKAYADKADIAALVRGRSLLEVLGDG